MTWHFTDSLDEFVTAAGAHLRSRPIAHTIPITVVDTLRRDLHHFGAGDPVFGWFRDGDEEVSGAVIRTPPFPAFITRAADVDGLVAALAGSGVPAVNAPADDALAIAEQWRRRGATVQTGLDLRLFRLAELTAPDPTPPGAARVAGVEDRDLLIDWVSAFHAEIHADDPPDAAAEVDGRLPYGGFQLWWHDGEPVAMAARTPTSAGMARVAHVYTPSAHRRHGYAAAITAAVSRAALADGAADVVLYTDLGNPTTNALYPRLGYRPVEDRTTLHITTPHRQEVPR